MVRKRLFIITNFFNELGILSILHKKNKLEKKCFKYLEEDEFCRLVIYS